MFRSVLLATPALCLCAIAPAQQQVQARKLISPLRDAGIYHVATGTWTRTGATANMGPDTIYSATAPSGYFGVGWEGGTGVDEGTLPGTGNLNMGPQDAYCIDGFQFCYCSLDVSIDWKYFFLDSYVPCDLPFTPANCNNAVGFLYSLTGLPAASACWIVTVDLTGYSTCMEADGGPCAPGYQGSGLGLDGFGIAHLWATPNGGTSGPILAGYDPGWAPPGEGTCYNTAATCAAGNTGLGAQDFFAIEGGALSPGCYFFGGYINTNGCGGPSQVPGAQFCFEIYTDCTKTCHSECGVVYCDTNPNQNGDIAIDNCVLDGSGNIITVTNAGSTLFAYLNVSASQGVVTDPPGSMGDLCLTGSPIGRYVHDLQAPQGSGTYSTDVWGGVTGGGVGNLPTPPGGQLMPCDTWNFQGWQRMPAGAPTTWSKALCVTFR